MTTTTAREASLDVAFDALAHPVRRAIIRRLARGETTVGELAEPFDLMHQAVSRHVGILRDRGLIHRRVDGQRRPCRLDIERMQDIADWILEQRREWESRLARLDGLLAAFWGGDHATIRPGSVAVDLRVGGTFQLETVGADGCSYPLRFRYGVVDPPRLLAFSAPDSGILTEVRLEPAGAGTTVVVHQRRLPPDLRTEQARTGLSGMLDRLATVVASATTDSPRREP